MTPTAFTFVVANDIYVARKPSAIADLAPFRAFEVMVALGSKRPHTLQAIQQILNRPWKLSQILRAISGRQHHIVLTQLARINGSLQPDQVD